MSGPRATAGDRLRRLLAIIPWIAERDGPTLAEVSDRFGVSTRELLADLEIVWMVGVHPFTPDELIEVTIQDERVWLRLNPGVFERPLRLTPDQALALVAAGNTFMAVEGADPDGPLARALAKVGAVLGIVPSEAVNVSFGGGRDVLDTLRDAVRTERQVSLDYFSFGRDERTQRLVDPHRVFTASGQWYLAAYCHRARAERLFRLDRVHGAELRGPRQRGAPPEAGREGLYQPEPDDPRVTLELAPSARWVPEQYVTDEVTVGDDGRLRVRLPVSAAPWLERLLLRLGPEASITSVDPPLSPEVGAAAARRVLARYRR